ncbi:MAG: DUF637 domain-containing protein, partial [Endozoicomonas sp.]|uniref:DUF637 domain-containing protein n=1 Tax=Endozoicomonas sp. TaxID=1892382 RepID=UPI003D9B83BF
MQGILFNTVALVFFVLNLVAPTQAQTVFHFKGGSITSDDGGFIDIIGSEQGTIIKPANDNKNGNIRIESAEISSNKPITFEVPRQAVSLTNTQVKAESVSVTASELHLLASRHTEDLQSASKKRGLGSKKIATHTEHHSRLNPSAIEALGYINIQVRTLVSEAAYLKAGTGITLNTEQWFALAGLEEHFVQDETRREGWLKNKHKVSGQQWTNVVHTRLDAPEVTINAQSIEAQVGIVPGETLEQSLGRLVVAYPELAWLNQVGSHHSHWQTLETSYRSWNQKHSGLSPLAGIVIGAAVTVATYGVGASFLPVSMGSNLIATNVANAAFSSMVARSSVAVVNHGGNLAAAIEEVFAEEAIKSVGVEVLAGAIMGGFDVPYRMTPEAPLALQIQNAAVRISGRASAGAVIKGGSLGGALEDAASKEAFTQLAAQLNYWAGNYAQQQGWEEGSLEKVALHAGTGALYGLLKDGKPLAAAAAGAAAQAVARISIPGDADPWDIDECWEPPCAPEAERFYLSSEQQESIYTKVLEVLSTLGAAIAAQITGGDPETGADIGQAQHLYNRQLHSEEVGALWQKIEKRTPEQQDRYKAAACFLTHCADSVHPSDAYHDQLQDWQEVGSNFGQEILELQATGLFTYSNADGWKDSIRASRATAVAHIILAGIEGVGFVTADLMAIKAGNMPLAAALWTAGTYVSGETLGR